jgi:hypothetical protein
MRKLILTMMAVLTGLSGLLAAETLSSGPQAGQELPGPFQTLDVTGPWAGRYHCPVCEHGLRPAALIFAREVPGADKHLANLLRTLDAWIDQHPEEALGAQAIFLNDGGYREALVGKIDEKAKVSDLPLTKGILFKEDKAAQLTALANDAKLKHVAVGIASPSALADYHLNKDAEVTVILYYKLKVVANWAFPNGEFTAEAGAKLLGEFKQALIKIDKAPRGGRSG